MKNHPLPLEGRSQLEAERHYVKWRSGCYQLLLSRTANCYGRKKNSERRQAIQSLIKIDLPEISDELLLSLYKSALKEHERKCRVEFENSGYQTTRREEVFQRTLEEVLTALPELSKYIEMYPSKRYSKDLPPGMKMAIGVHVPDFVLFGIKKKGASSVVFEIDGDAHVKTYSRDLQKDMNLAELDIFTVPIQNEQAGNRKYIEAVIRGLTRKRSGALDKQILRNKRKIWAKTIACQYTMEEIEHIARSKFGVELNLTCEASELSRLENCPRSIRAEWLRLSSAAP